ncbi:sigma-70 family RNA polymerase sigma factor [Arthrobacter sp. UM1]|uniref:sigma-70 family RNA polymerase sigma factor n=1 Tax=Arthrobacter sp. UM1 TaxID=2766776 RepID=UPI001CF6E4F9|nr:sigma-70 family RNA polymerase sigma factor [Arthrobacter sp. UM1]
MQTTALAVDDGRADAELIAACRVGDTDAFEVLYARHAAAVQSVARRHVRNVSDAEDLTSEAFAKVFELLKNGGGPHSFFRAYVCTTVSRLAFAQNDKAAQTALTDEPELFDDPSERYVDPVMSKFESGVVSRAFRSLPERWQAVLWYSSVDEMAPSAIAPLLGLSPNGVSALLVRAREGLRNAYVQEHVHLVDDDDACAPIASMLGAYVRDGLSARNRTKVSDHLESCGRCSALIGQLEDVGSSMRAVVLPLYIGVAASFAPLVGVGVTGTVAGSGAALSHVPWWKAVPRPALVAAAGTGVLAVAGTAVLWPASKPSAPSAPSAAASAPAAAAGAPSSGSAASAAPRSSASPKTPGAAAPSRAAGAAQAPALPAAAPEAPSSPQAAAPVPAVQGAAPQSAPWSLPAGLTQRPAAPEAPAVPAGQQSPESEPPQAPSAPTHSSTSPAAPAPSHVPTPSSSESPKPSPSASGPTGPRPSGSETPKPGGGRTDDGDTGNQNQGNSDSNGNGPPPSAPASSSPLPSGTAPASASPSAPSASAPAPSESLPPATGPSDSLPSGTAPSNPASWAPSRTRPGTPGRAPFSSTRPDRPAAPHWDPSRGWIRPSGGTAGSR